MQNYKSFNPNGAPGSRFAGLSNGKVPGAWPGVPGSHPGLPPIRPRVPALPPASRGEVNNDDDIICLDSDSEPEEVVSSFFE